MGIASIRRSIYKAAKAGARAGSRRSRRGRKGRRRKSSGGLVKKLFGL